MVDAKISGIPANVIYVIFIFNFVVCNITHYICSMIINIAHKGLRMFYEHGLSVKLPTEQLSKIRRILGMLDAVTSEDDIKAIGLSIHKLKGEYSGFWALSVTGNYRIIFRFHAGDVYDVDYLDYH